MSDVRSASGVELLILDVDGVLTEGSVIHGPAGHELKHFSTKDGFGLTLWRRMGFRASIITGRSSQAVATRATELSIAPVIQGVGDKEEAFERLLAEVGTTADRVCVMGDDWPDIRIMKRAAYAIAPADAVPETRAAADHVTAASGGRGAVREAVEHLLRAKGLFDRAKSFYH